MNKVLLDKLAAELVEELLSTVNTNGAESWFTICRRKLEAAQERKDPRAALN